MIITILLKDYEFTKNSKCNEKLKLKKFEKSKNNQNFLGKNLLNLTFRNKKFSVIKNKEKSQYIYNITVSIK